MVIPYCFTAMESEASQARGESAISRDATHGKTAITAVFSVLPAEFELGRAMAAAPVSWIGFEGSFSGDEPVQSQFRAETTDADALETALGEVGSVETVTRAEDGAIESLFEIEWASSIEGEGIIGHLLTCEARMVDVTGTSEGWEFECGFESGDDLSAFHDACVDDEIVVDMLRLHHST